MELIPPGVRDGCAIRLREVARTWGFAALGRAVLEYAAAYPMTSQYSDDGELLVDVDERAVS